MKDAVPAVQTSTENQKRAQCWRGGEVVEACRTSKTCQRGHGLDVQEVRRY